MTNIEHNKLVQELRYLFPSKKQNYKNCKGGAQIYPLEIGYLDRKKTLSIKARLIKGGEEVRIFNEQMVINENIISLYNDFYKFLPIDCHLYEYDYREISKSISFVTNKLKKKVKKNTAYNHVKKPVSYIMKDCANGLYKIGKSINPFLRERTLQSEKPTIKLIKQFTKDIEKELHDRYKDQRVRGEWFNLTPIQVQFICFNYNKNRSNE